jgi:hypothetical protein
MANLNTWTILTGEIQSVNATKVNKFKSLSLVQIVHFQLTVHPAETDYVFGINSYTTMFTVAINHIASI